VIRADLDLLSDLADDPGDGGPAPLRKHARAKRAAAKAPERPAFPPPVPVPAWARASGRAGQGDPLFAVGASLALLDAFLRRDPPPAGALRHRLALMSAAACAKILRLNADAAALRDLRFATGDNPGPAPRLLRLWREFAGRPPSLDPGRITDAAARLDLALRQCQGNGGSSTCSATAISRAAIYAARARHSAKAAERLCL
jgi:Protein of unknown function (DUF1403)